jgi:hypothetical protein
MDARAVEGIGRVERGVLGESVRSFYGSERGRNLLNLRFLCRRHLRQPTCSAPRRETPASLDWVVSLGLGRSGAITSASELTDTRAFAIMSHVREGN